jgi:glycosyltransferase involved in cell wall biosynthesis
MWWPHEVAATIRARRPDVVHLHSGVWLKGARAAKLAGVPAVVFTDHGRPWPDRLSGRLFDHMGSRYTQTVVAVSEPLRRHLQARLWIPQSRLAVVRNGIREPNAPSEGAVLAARTTAGLNPQDLVIGSIGRLDPVKAYDVLIRAVTRLRDGWSEPRVPKLLLVGDGPDRSRLEKVVADLGAGSFVRFAGWQRDVHPYLAAMDLFVLSSDSEGTSISLLEAMASEKAVVATDVGGNADVLGPGLATQLVRPQDPVRLAEVIAATIRNPVQSKAVGATALNRFRNEYSMDAMLSAYADLYSACVSMPR